MNGIERYLQQVRSFEAFKYLHVGMISEVKRKTLPAISHVVGLNNEQGLLHFKGRIAIEIRTIKRGKIERMF